jgi:hypothetical protein
MSELLREDEMKIDDSFSRETAVILISMLTECCNRLV